MNTTTHEHRRWGRRGARVVAVLAVAASAAVVGSVDSSSALDRRSPEVPVRPISYDQVDRSVAGGRLTFR